MPSGGAIGIGLAQSPPSGSRNWPRAERQGPPCSAPGRGVSPSLQLLKRAQAREQLLWQLWHSVGDGISWAMLEHRLQTGLNLSSGNDWDRERDYAGTEKESPNLSCLSFNKSSFTGRGFFFIFLLKDQPANWWMHWHACVYTHTYTYTGTYGDGAFVVTTIYFLLQ